MELQYQSDLREKIIAAVAGDLVAIEKALEDNLSPYLDLVSDVARHILFSGGKRLRPLLMVLSARICGYSEGRGETYSAIFEYLHAATLLHDDIVDGATLRRGEPVAHSLWGYPTAVLVGDFLLARSLSIASKTGRPDVIKTIAHITENMSQGEIDQLSKKGQVDLTEAEYMQVIHRKTSVLIAGACQVGAMIADASSEKVKALADYGHHLGLAFQMADDRLDYTADTEILGKKVGADIKEGKLTLPVIHALEKADASDRASLAQIINNPDFNEDDFNLFIGLLKKWGGLQYTLDKATQHVQEAKKALGIFDVSATKNTLIDIADYAMERKF
jgi:octaprenyl-diphosphate synthase